MGFIKELTKNLFKIIERGASLEIEIELLNKQEPNSYLVANEELLVRIRTESRGRYGHRESLPS